jgi:hypothetical protein
MVVGGWRVPDELSHSVGGQCSDALHEEAIVALGEYQITEARRTSAVGVGVDEEPVTGAQVGRHRVATHLHASLP